MNIKKAKIFDILNKTFEIMLSILVIYLIVLSIGFASVLFDYEEQEEEHNIWILIENEKRIIKKE